MRTRAHRHVGVPVVAGLVLATLVALAVVRWANPPFDRAAAVDHVVARGGGRVTRQQAECYVDRVVAELGRAALEQADPAPEQVSQLRQLRVDCIGVANLGTLPPTGSVPGSGPARSAPAGTSPDRPGDDPRLDELYAACAAGSGASCDQLVDESPVGSTYERFGLTCGDRTSELRCADVYPGPAPGRR